MDTTQRTPTSATSILMCAFNKKIADELNKRLKTLAGSPPASISWSDEQFDIYSEFEHGTSNVVIVARAGTGKTTTALEGVRRMPESKQVVAKTLHGVGFGIVVKFWDNVGVYDFKRHPVSRADILTHAAAPKAPDAIKRLISKLHSLARETAPFAMHGADLTDLALEFECAPDESWEEMGYGLSFVCDKAVQAMVLAAASKPAFIDYSDMIFLPLRNNWTHKAYEAVIVDEAQDMTLAQLELAQRVCKGRMIIIGDDRQAIYAFRGADSGSLGRLKAKLNAVEYPLRTTYRCGHAIVALAQQLVPDFEAAAGNCAGDVSHLMMPRLVGEAGPGDFILSRLNAPLVSTAMKLLRSGKRTRIAGKQIGKGLIALIRKLKARSVPDLLLRINAWAKKEETRIKARFTGSDDALRARIENVNDQAAMLASIAEESTSVDDAILKLETLFTDDGLGDAGIITCSSVHRSKGLEAKRVFILADTLRDHNQEELNIRYVAITRAIETLVFVHEAKEE